MKTTCLLFIPLLAMGVQQISPNDLRIRMEGAQYVTRSAEGLSGQRHSDAVRALDSAASGFNAEKALTDSGIVLTFRTDSRTITLRFSALPGENRGSEFAVFENGRLTETFDCGKQKEMTLHVSATEAGMSRFEITLPSFSHVRFQGLEIDEDSILGTSEGHRRCYVALGDSITHGTGQGSATWKTWPFLVSRELDMELFNLAVGGAKVSVPTAGMLADWKQIDLITVLVGFNDYNGAGKTPERYRADYQKMLDAIRKNHPDTPVHCITPLTTTQLTGRKTGLPIEPFRQVVRDVVTERQAAGDTNLHLIAGETITTEADLRDTVHLNEEGAARFANKLVPLLKPQKTASVPNFVVILTDDLGYGDIGCYGNERVKTPNIDRMAAEGMRFTDFYVAAAQCSPTRAAFLTGSYPQRINTHRLFGAKDTTGLNPDEITIAELLKEQGYATGCIGKWHLGHKPPFHPNNHGFDYFYGFLDPAYFNKENRLIHRNQEIVAKGPETSAITDDLTREAVEFIERNRAQPFFLYLAHDMPHVPLELPAERRGKSEWGFYGDVIEHLDDAIGQVFQTLEKCGVDENTIVVFTSDNGPARHWGIEAGSSGPLRGSKHTTCEGGMRVPFIARAPGLIPAGRTCSEIATIMDLLPTFTELAGGTVPADRVIDGKNIWPLLAGWPGSQSPHAAFFYYKRDDKAGHIEGVRVGNWKLRVPLEKYHRQALDYAGDFSLSCYGFDENGNLPPVSERFKWIKPNLKKIQAEAAREEIGLYNLADDLGEKNNLAAQYPEKVNELKSMMLRFDEQLRAHDRPLGQSD